MDRKPPARPGRRRREYTQRERKLSALAERQHGILSRRQLLDAGLGLRAIGRRVETGRLRCVHRGVYAFAPGSIGVRGKWMAAVLACGDRALLSHRSAAALWGLMKPHRGPIDVSGASGRRRDGIAVHEGAIFDADRTTVVRIPVTTVARTLFDLAEVAEEPRLRRAAEEADRLGLLSRRDLEAVCARSFGRRAMRPVRGLLDDMWFAEDTQSPLEDRVLELCREHGLPAPVVGARVLGREVDFLWPAQRVMVEADSWEFHSHRDAFERDRARDATMQAEGYRVIRLTHRRLDRERTSVVAELRSFLGTG